MASSRIRSIWGEATALFHLTRRFGWIDLLVAMGLAGFGNQR